MQRPVARHDKSVMDGKRLLRSCGLHPGKRAGKAGHVCSRRHPESGRSRPGVTYRPVVVTYLPRCRRLGLRACAKLVSRIEPEPDHFWRPDATAGRIARTRRVSTSAGRRCTPLTHPGSCSFSSLARPRPGHGPAFNRSNPCGYAGMRLTARPGCWWICQVCRLRAEARLTPWRR